MATIRVPARFEGPTGFGQGGWTSQRLAQLIDAPVTIAIRTPIPLDTELTAVRPSVDDEPWLLTTPDRTTVLEAAPWVPDCPTTEPVSLADAEGARGRFPLPGELHPVPHCFACGLQPDTMAVHAGPLGDGRFATPWTVPAWAGTESGVADDAIVWGALDCTAAWYVGCEGGIRRSVTAQLAVEVLTPLRPGETYALVAWAGHWESGTWDGRKRGAASAAFDEDGACVARSTSFWIALE